MKVNQAIELEDGTLDFQANLSEDELQMVIEVGLNVLFAHGTVPFLNKKEMHTIQAGSTTPQ